MAKAGVEATAVEARAAKVGGLGARAATACSHATSTRTQLTQCIARHVAFECRRRRQLQTHLSTPVAGSKLLHASRQRCLRTLPVRVVSAAAPAQLTGGLGGSGAGLGGGRGGGRGGLPVDTAKIGVRGACVCV